MGEDEGSEECERRERQAKRAASELRLALFVYSAVSFCIAPFPLLPPELKPGQHDDDATR